VTGATDLVAEMLAHGVVASSAVQILIRRLPVASPAARHDWRVWALALPVLLPPLFDVLAPFRRDEWFGDLALFWTPRWTHLVVFGLPVREIGLALLAGAGLVLLAPDVRRLAAGAIRGRREARRLLAPGHPAAAALRREVAVLASSLGIRAPEVGLVDGPRPVLHCRGVVGPMIVAARTAVERLPPDELRAVVAHELAHVRRHDVLRGWVLLALRVVQWFNPVAQIAARRAVQEAEWEADRVAARATGHPLAVARALIRSVRGRDTEFLGLLGSSRIASIEERCQRLLALQRDGDLAPGGSPVQLAFVIAALSAMLFFIV
jgi:Zn-dependent protease with chaperone function